MRVRELWPILAPAARRSSLGELAVKSFDPSGPEVGCQLLTIGFNASAWMYALVNVFSWRQAGTGWSHEMKIIFRRLSAISQIPLHAYFVFDGLDRPQLKRGKNITAPSAPRLLAQRFQELLTAFGFNWHMAPGEVEAELAYLQSLGLIDAVATPYNDALLFGATCIIRSIPHIGRYEDVYVYTPDSIEKCASLEWGDFLLVTLMCSTEDDAGRCWCSVEVARRLAYYGFGRSLLEAAVSFQFVEFMNFIAKWRDDICEVLRTDPRSLLGGRHYELARIIKEECTQFPDPAVLAMYLLPLTSWSDGHSPDIVTASRQPDLQSLAAFCLQHLSWSPEIVQSELEAACAGTAMRALLQLPGKANSEGLRHGLRVSGYSDDRPLPTYKISVLSRSLAVPLDVGPFPIVHMSPPGQGEDSGNDSFYEMEIPAVVLEYSWPDLVRGSARLSSQLPCMELKAEDVGDRSPESAVNTDIARSPEAGVHDSMSEA
ncbi:PIN domain-like protein [Pisolithus microcarpus]|nr:PIN domain-like protein [Pisolithus microcarpus]KAI6029098.1 PIN domain-like protein [Pisolithus microcarpus]